MSQFSLIFHVLIIKFITGVLGDYFIFKWICFLIKELETKDFMGKKCYRKKRLDVMLIFYRNNYRMINIKFIYQHLNIDKVIFLSLWISLPQSQNSSLLFDASKIRYNFLKYIVIVRNNDAISFAFTAFRLLLNTERFQFLYHQIGTKWTFW